MKKPALFVDSSVRQVSSLDQKLMCFLELKMRMLEISTKARKPLQNCNKKRKKRREGRK
jgi:hypothetical protein